MVRKRIPHPALTEDEAFMLMCILLEKFGKVIPPDALPEEIFEALQYYGAIKKVYLN